MATGMNAGGDGRDEAEGGKGSGRGRRTARRGGTAQRDNNSYLPAQAREGAGTHSVLRRAVMW